MTRLPLSRLLTPLALAGLLAGCGGELDDNRYPTGSRSIVASADYQVLHAVDTDGGRIASHDLQSGTTQLVEGGDRPVRIARSGDRILATLRGEPVPDSGYGDIETAQIVRKTHELRAYAERDAAQAPRQVQEAQGPERRGRMRV